MDRRVPRVRPLAFARLGFVLLLLTPCVAVSELPTRFPTAARIVAIGDLHGDLAATRRAFRLAGAIDERDRWVGGDLVVVQTGDQLDRGDDEQEILELLERLTGEAEQAGGHLHILNGNHETMNASLDLRYVTEGGFLDFEDAVVVDEGDSTLAAFPAEQRARVVALRPGGAYGAFLAARNTAVIVGDNLFVHGGILPEHVDYGLEGINREIRAWMADEAEEPQWIRGKGSLVWTRLYSDEPDDAACDTLGVVLERLGVSRMVVGHTVQTDGITPNCEERVWCIDVGMAAHYGGEPQVLEIVGDSVRALREEVEAAR